jgi:hypothetical protein
VEKANRYYQFTVSLLLNVFIQDKKKKFLIFTVLMKIFRKFLKWQNRMQINIISAKKVKDLIKIISTLMFHS